MKEAKERQSANTEEPSTAPGEEFTSSWRVACIIARLLQACVQASEGSQQVGAGAVEMSFWPFYYHGDAADPRSPTRKARGPSKRRRGQPAWNSTASSSKSLRTDPQGRGSERMAPASDLRNAAGKAAVAGILLRTRWAVRALHSVLHARLKEVESSAEGPEEHEPSLREEAEQGAPLTPRRRRRSGLADLQ